jgi:hypothetical protein
MSSFQSLHCLCYKGLDGESMAPLVAFAQVDPGVPGRRGSDAAGADYESVYEEKDNDLNRLGVLFEVDEGNRVDAESHLSVDAADDAAVVGLAVREGDDALTSSGAPGCPPAWS